MGSLWEFASCDFYHVFAVIPQLVLTDGAGKSNNGELAFPNG